MPASVRTCPLAAYIVVTPRPQHREKHYKPSSITTRSKDKKTQSRCSDKEKVWVPSGHFSLGGIHSARFAPRGGDTALQTYYTHISTPAVNSRGQGWLQQAAHARWLHTPHNGSARAFYCRCRLCCKGRMTSSHSRGFPNRFTTHHDTTAWDNNPKHGTKTKTNIDQKHAEKAYYHPR